MARIHRDVLADMADRLFEHAMTDRRARAAIERALAEAQGLRVHAAGELDAAKSGLESARAELAATRDALAAAASERDALLSSTCWRATAPLRAAAIALRRFRSRQGA